MRARYQLRLGILATLAGFLQFFVTAIIVKSLGILLVSMGGELRADTWVLGSVFALIECVSDVLAPLAGPVGSAVGHRQAVMLGGVLVSMGFVAASQATNVLQVALLLNLPLATGYCLTNVLTRASLGEYFDSRNFALASGITKTGVSISLVCLPPLVQLFNDMYGWRGTMLLVGSIGAHLVVCGALLIPLPEAAMDRNPRAEYEPLTDSQSSKLLSRLANKCGTTMSLKPLVLRAGKDLNLSLLRNGNFWIVACIFVATRITNC
ncbi:monocarboxylate transporter 13-like [Acanthaster planci]|uniref:Monocarboxylate transporter 13-like n=1 Tax=Acanthaster planci TaxID=133434 RepID=A0A8B7Z854_ACAPL|nr:monocarboxylate transporter 13-like [Acanthaster planci]